MKYTAAKKRVLAALILSYSAAYLCRTNISMLLPSLTEAFSLSSAQAGLIATVFAVIYAAGQLAVGLTVDRVSPRLMIGLGLVLSCICNAACACAQGYGWVMGLWALNAAAQSMLWTPCVRMLAVTFAPEERSSASFALSLTLVIGYVAAWLVTGGIVSAVHWRMGFLVPSLLTLLCAGVALLLMRGAKIPPEKKSPARARERGLWRVMAVTGLLPVLAGCVCNGFMRDSIMTWAPTILMETQGLALDGVLGVALIIPAVNFLGILLGRRCYGRMGHSARRSSALLLALGAAFSRLLLLFSGTSPLVCAALLAAGAAMSYGVNPLLTTMLPLEYDRLKRVGAAAGMVDAFIYLGSGLAGVTAGAVSQLAGWNAVFALWAVSALCGAGLLLWSAGRRFMGNL